MSNQPGVWGIDIGQCALKAVRLEVIDGVVTATAFDYVEHPKILSQPDADPDQLTREALQTFLSRNNIKGDEIAISIPGQSGLARFVKLPPVEEKKIVDIVRFEAKQQIPFPLEEVVWDYQKIGAGIVTDGFAMDTEIGLFAMKRDMINRALHHFKSVGIEVHHVQMAPLSLTNYVAYDLLKRKGSGELDEGIAEENDDTPPGKKRCVVALDLGTDGSSLIITDGEKVIWQRPIPIGGNHFTRALTKDLKLTFAKAEHLKRNAAKSPDLAKILKALKPVLTDFVNEVQRSLGYFTNTHRDAHIAYMVGVGSAFRLPGLQRFLSEKLQLDVRRPATFERLVGEGVVNAPVFTENLLSFPVAYGLALQGLKLSRLVTNLLPSEIQLDRKIREKKPWAIAAAACLLLGLGVMTLGYSVKSNALGNPLATSGSDVVYSAVKAADDAVKLAGAKNTEASTRKKEVDDTTNDVKSIIAGKDERLNWIELNKFINVCLPQPSGVNLTNPSRPNQLQYWKTAAGMSAFDQLRRRRIGDPNLLDVPLDEEALQNLATVDVDAVYCLYAEDLKAFMERAKSHTKDVLKLELDGIDDFVPPTVDGTPPKKPSETPPEGSGWVVELRGYTYHNGGRQFVRDTLVYNLNKFGHSLPRWGRKNWRKFSPPTAPAAAGATTGGVTATPATNLPDDPVLQRVSHAFIYNVWPVKEGQSSHIHTSYVSMLLSGGGGGGQDGGPSGPGMPGGGQGTGMAGAGGIPMMPPGAGGGKDGMGGGGGSSSRSSWAPVGPGSGGGGGGGGQGMGPGAAGGGPGAGMGLPSGPGMDGRGSMDGGAPGGAAGAGAIGGMGGPPGGPAGGAAAASSRARNRYEFVVIFVWREPTPSDKLLKTEGN
jgi:type IV pilus assembly protein PilM